MTEQHTNSACPADCPAPDRGKPSLLGRLRNQIRRIAKSEMGTASMEFVIVVPVVMAIFMASIESGLFMTRFILMEQSVDKVMRKLRLGEYPTPTAASLKTEICSRSVILNDCAANITIELRPVSTTTWDFPTSSTACVDRDNEITPATTFRPGAAHEIMMVRVCVIQNAMFPLTGIGLKMAQDSQGGYALVTASAFVNEP